MSWQPAEKVQKNQQGQYRALINGQWTPVSKAQKNAQGQYRVMMDSVAPVAEDTALEQKANDKPSFLKGAIGALKSGPTVGFSDEIEGAIGAAIAYQFVSDRSFPELYREARDSVRAENNAFRNEYPKTALGLELAGGIATGGGLASLGKMSAAKSGAVIGGTAGLGYSDANTAGGAITDTAIGALSGAVFGKVLSVAGNAIRRAVSKPTLQVFDQSGKFTDDAIKELEKMVGSGKATADEMNTIVRQNLQKAGVLTPEQAGRYNLFTSHGINPNRFNVTQATDDAVQLQSAMKRTGPVSEAVSKQDEQIINAVTGQIQKTGAKTSGLSDVNASVYRVIDDVVTKADEAVTQAYRAAEKTAGKQFRVTPERFVKAINRNRGQENVSGGVISAIKGVLKDKGVIRQGADIAIEKGAKRTTSADLRSITVKEAEEIRQQLNALYDSVSPQGRRLIRDLKNALDDDVEWYAADKGIFKEARAAKQAFHRMLETGKRNKFDQSGGNLIEDIVYNKVPEEKILDKLISPSTRDADVNALKRFLIKDAGEGGAQAWNDLRGQVLRNALDKAISTQGKGEGGQAVFNSGKFKTSLESLMRTKKYDAIFSPDEQRFIKEMIEIGQMRIPQRMAQQGQGPSEVAVNQLRLAFMQKMPFGNRAQELIEAVSNLRADRRMLDVTRETQKALTK